MSEELDLNPTSKPKLKPGPYEEHAIRRTEPVPFTAPAPPSPGSYYSPDGIPPSESVAVAQQQPMVVQPQQAPSVGQMLSAVIEKGVTAENVAAISKLVGLYERMEDKRSEREFATAFVRLQAIMPKVNATKAVPDRNGGVKYKFAPLEDIVREVGPSLKECGFTYSFSERYADGRMIETCTIMHVGGHSRSNEFSVRVGSGPPGCTETQADGAASQYARRYALCDALGIVIEHLDQDARLEGGLITREQAEELARRVNETNSDRAAFLKLAGAESFFEIRAAKYDLLDAMLQKKERRGK